MSQSLARQILLRARDIIADPKRWAVRAMAFNKSGDSCDPWEHDAVTFCSLGAIERASLECGIRGNASPLVLAAESSLADTINPHWLCEHRARNPAIAKGLRSDAEALGAQDVITSFNDRNHHIDVLAVFDKALERVT
jgi:hypothetical protein